MISYSPDEVTPSFNDNNWDRVVELRRMSHKEYVNTPDWKQTSNWAKGRLGRRCNMCGFTGSPENWLEVNHLNYDRIGCETLGDLEVLDHECHKEYHGVEDNYI